MEINLHHEGEIAALARQFEPTDPEDAQITVLAAFPGEGRRYLRRCAVAYARRRGLRVFSAELDLDGAEVERLSLQAYWEFQQAKRGIEASPEAQAAFERLAGRTPTPGLTELSLAAALIGLDEESAPLIPRLVEALDADKPWEALARSLEDEERLAAHFVDNSEIPAPLRRLLLDLAMEEPRLKVLISSHRREGVGKVVRGRPNARFEVMPLDRGEFESMVEMRLESPGIPAEVYDQLYRAAGGGVGATAWAVERLADAGLLVRREDGGWLWRGGDDLELPNPFGEALGEQGEDSKLLASFVHLAALCGDNIPVKQLLRFLGVAEDDLDDVIDRVDETLGADSDVRLFAERFQHPSMPGEIVYGFENAAVAYGLRESLTETTRGRLAIELVQAIAQETPLSSRAGVRLLAEICRHAGADENRQELERELAWRVGQPDVELLERTIVEDVRGGQLPVAVVWKAVNAGQLRWPPYRTLAVLDALSAVVPAAGLPPAFHAIRSGVLLQLGLNAEAQEAAQAGLDLPSDDALLTSALWERLGTAQKRRGFDAEAEQSLGQSRLLHEKLLEAGDARVVPLFEQAVQALQAGGRLEEAELLRRKLQAVAKPNRAG